MFSFSSVEVCSYAAFFISKIAAINISLRRPDARHSNALQLPKMWHHDVVNR